MLTVLMVNVLSRIWANRNVEKIDWRDELLTFGFNLYASMTLYVIFKLLWNALL
jgi:hypothetical protein